MGGRRLYTMKYEVAGVVGSTLTTTNIRVPHSTIHFVEVAVRRLIALLISVSQITLRTLSPLLRAQLLSRNFVPALSLLIACILLLSEDYLQAYKSTVTMPSQLRVLSLERSLISLSALRRPLRPRLNRILWSCRQ